MSSYRGTAEQPERAAAIAAVVAIHVVLAIIILSGLDVRNVRRAVESMTTIAIEEPPPPPPIELPKPAPKPQPMKKPEGAAARKAEPTPVVAPQPKLPVPSPLPAARVAGTGSSTQSGAAAGTGTGAGGSGTGMGGGGSGGFTPAQKITKIPNNEYRRLVEVSGMDRGTVGVSIRVTPDGRASNCRVVRSSGNRYADALMCQLTEEYVRFRPALDPNGRAVAQDVTWYPNWSRL
ncbi:MAG: TonB family protein [Sphingomonas sp.]|nr:TonB family protein [Sphingomonas sp.]